MLGTGPDVVSHCGHVNFDEVQGAIYLASHTLGNFSFTKRLSILLSYRTFLLSQGEN